MSRKLAAEQGLVADLLEVEQPVVVVQLMAEQLAVAEQLVVELLVPEHQLRLVPCVKCSAGSYGNISYGIS